MASTATLTSLAMLKVNIDQGKDYLEYLVPFILQVLVDHTPDRVTGSVVRDYIREDFGLEIPERAVQLVLRRLSRRYPLKKQMHVYRITGKLPNPQIRRKKAEAERHIQAIVAGLKEYSRATPKPIDTDERAVKAICAFLAEFDISCLRAYLLGSAIPKVDKKRVTDTVLISQYLLHLQERDPERFDSFMILVQGHMLANALLAPDLQNAPKNYRGVTLFLDTPLVLRLLGLEGERKQAATEELTRLLQKLGGKIAVFSHTRDETRHVIEVAAEHVDKSDGRGSIVMEARRSGRTKSDLLLIAGKLEDKLFELGVEVKRTPKYTAEHQIDEIVFEDILEDEVTYYNPRAKEYDINSVRSIYALRQGTSPSTLEKAHAVLVTSNSGFAHAAYEYGEHYEETREVSSVITDFSLANMAWLKAPMGAPSLPQAETLALAYAALQPSKALLTKYLSEIDKLEREDKITPRDHQLLRSSVLAQDELMHLTLGDEKELTEETVTETLHRVTEEIKKEETEKLQAERNAHRKTRQELESERKRVQRIQGRLYWRCHKKAKFWARAISLSVVFLLAAGLVVGSLKLWSNNRTLTILLKIILSSITLGSFILGWTVKGLHQWVKQRLHTSFIKREAAAIGMNLSKFNDTA